MSDSEAASTKADLEARSERRNRRVTARVVEDQSVVTMLYPNGVIGVAEASFLGSSAPFLVEAHGTEGSLLYDPSGGLRTRRRGAD
jgi:1,5-anhydro-D-fructose reductase (1,5-anhydro-D-mannitol-forming)